MGLLGPLVFLFLLSQTRMGMRSPATLLVLASLVGIGTFGANALGAERRGIGLLVGFPVERWRILVAKNLAAIAFRAPALATLVIAGLALAPLATLPAALVIALVTLLVCAGVDNYLSVLFPVAMPAPGQSAYQAPVAGSRGLTAAFLGAALLFVAVAIAAPFVFLAWLPLLLERAWLWLVSLPLALAGGVSVYAMLVAGAAGLLRRREPEVLERILGEA
jgi:hypothetical protein